VETSLEIIGAVVAIVVIIGTAIGIWQRAITGQNLTALVDRFTQFARTKQAETEAKAKSPPCHHEWDTIKEERMQNANEQQFLLILQCKYCGILDKTLQTLKSPESKSECRHSWERQKGTVLDSAYEQIAEGERFKRVPVTNGKVKELEDLEPWMFRKTYTCSRICTKCGLIDTITASNFDLEDVPKAE
jgi:hypothetical protein